MGLRVVVVTLLLGCSIAFQITKGEQVHTFYALIATTYALTIVYAMVGPWLTDFVGLTRFAYVQIGVDLILESILVAMTGAVESIERMDLLMDKIFLKVPVMGDLIRKSAVAKFTRTLGTLITSGVPLLDGLAITAKTAGNKVIEQVVLEARISISGGKTIAEPLSKGEVFPRMVTHMIAVGETTGALDAMLGKIADFYEEEVDTAVATLTSLLEPPPW